MKGSITKRWVKGSLVTTTLIMILAEVLTVIYLRNSYYSRAENAILSRISTINGTLTAQWDLSEAQRTGLIYNLIEDFSEKDKFEVMVIGTNGKVLTTSTGFMPADSGHLRDIALARQSADGIATNIYRTSVGEKVLTATCIIRKNTESIYAVRLVTSLEKVDTQINIIISMAVVFFFVVMGFVLMSGMYFIGSIVKPVRDIEAGAARISKGEFNVRIKNTYNDEIGQLCDAINNMAAELGKTDEIKNDFISSVSHELRTPLTAIKGWAETMENSVNDPATVKKGTKVILSETERLNSMVENLLDFSRLQQSDLKFTKEKLDLAAEISDAVIMFTPRCKQNGIELVFDEPEDIIAVYADKSRIKQIMVNLLDNAVKYTPPGGKIQVLMESDRKKNTVSVSVVDNGQGIAPEDIDKVTQKFYKGKNSKRGSGIGLALVKEIVEAHGGTFNAESRQGEYTKMTFTLRTVRTMKGK